MFSVDKKQALPGPAVIVDIDAKSVPKYLVPRISVCWVSTTEQENDDV
jgi:hypothetical protein